MATDINIPGYLTTEQVAERLDMNIWSVRKAVARGTLRPHGKIGVASIFARAEVDRYRREHRRVSKENPD